MGEGFFGEVIEITNRNDFKEIDDCYEERCTSSGPLRVTSYKLPPT